MDNDKLKVLAKFLGEDDLDFVEAHYSDDYLVLTNEEADDAIRENIESSVWLFNPSFLAAHSCLSERVITILQESMHDDSNGEIKDTIEDFDNFVEDAILSDGRGHFLSGYDGEEHEVDGFFIYRQN